VEDTSTSRKSSTSWVVDGGSGNWYVDATFLFLLKLKG